MLPFEGLLEGWRLGQLLVAACLIFGLWGAFFGTFQFVELRLEQRFLSLRSVKDLNFVVFFDLFLFVDGVPIAKFLLDTFLYFLFLQKSVYAAEAV